jgi:hypothetical protein
MNIELYAPEIIDIHRTRDRTKVRLRPHTDVASPRPVGCVVELTFASDKELQVWLDRIQEAKDKPLPEAR